MIKESATRKIDTTIKKKVEIHHPTPFSSTAKLVVGARLAFAIIVSYCFSIYISHHRALSIYRSQSNHFVFV